MDFDNHSAGRRTLTNGNIDRVAFDNGTSDYGEEDVLRVTDADRTHTIETGEVTKQGEDSGLLETGWCYVNLHQIETLAE